MICDERDTQMQETREDHLEAREDGKRIGVCNGRKQVAAGAIQLRVEYDWLTIAFQRHKIDRHLHFSASLYYYPSRLLTYEECALYNLLPFSRLL